MRGGRPLPLNIKQFRGNPGKRALNYAEPKIDAYEEMPDPPRALCQDAKEEWYRVLPYLLNNRILGPEGLSNLCVYCNMHAHIVALEKEGRLPEPAFICQYRLMAAEFALTPTSRSRVKAGTSENKNAKKERFFAQG